MATCTLNELSCQQLLLTETYVGVILFESLPVIEIFHRFRAIPALLLRNHVDASSEIAIVVLFKLVGLLIVLQGNVVSVRCCLHFK